MMAAGQQMSRDSRAVKDKKLIVTTLEMALPVTLGTIYEQETFDFLILSVHFDNPLEAQSQASIPVVLVSARPNQDHPSERSLRFGMKKAGAGELLVDLNTLLGAFTGTPWLGPDHPARVEISIPEDPALAGHEIYMQGFLFDPSRGARVKFSRTQAIKVEIE